MKASYERLFLLARKEICFFHFSDILSQYLHFDKIQTLWDSTFEERSLSRLAEEKKNLEKLITD